MRSTSCKKPVTAKVRALDKIKATTGGRHDKSNIFARFGQDCRRNHITHIGTSRANSTVNSGLRKTKKISEQNPNPTPGAKTHAKRWRNWTGRIDFFFNDTATTEIYTLSLHDALPIFRAHGRRCSTRASTWCSTCGPGGLSRA